MWGTKNVCKCWPWRKVCMVMGSWCSWLEKYIDQAYAQSRVFWHEGRPWGAALITSGATEPTGRRQRPHMARSCTARQQGAEPEQNARRAASARDKHYQEGTTLEGSLGPGASRTGLAGS